MKKDLFAKLIALVFVVLNIASCSTPKSEENKEETPKMPEAVDLGLSVKWASWNVGAEAPEEYGNYYAWGSIKNNSDQHFYYGEYNDIGSDISGTEYDVARIEWGNNWRIPTLDEMKELINCCTWEWTTINGKTGYKISGNGNSIFLPAGGYTNSVTYNDREVRGCYWTSTINSGFASYANYLNFGSTHYEIIEHYRNMHRSIRPVKD